MSHHALQSWAMLGLVAVSRVYRSLLLSLVVVATVPMLWDWSSHVVRSGSMEPSISAGDVAVADPLSVDDDVPVGRVAVLTAPSGERTDGTLIHRVVEDRKDGTYTTAGDANGTVDTRPVEREDVQARARILVPYVGRPFLWAANGEAVNLLLFGTLTVAAFVVASGSSGGRSRGRRTGGRTPRPTRRRVALALSVAVAGGASVTEMQTTAAAFTSRTVNASSTWTVAAATPQLYDSRIMVDVPYTYYRLDEQGGTSMLDSSGNGYHGTYASVAAYRSTGALPNNVGYSIGLNAASGRLVSGGSAIADPTTFTLELWFRTTTKSGGKLIGFESTRNATSPTYDRQVFMRTDGRLAYAGSSAANASILTSPLAYNDGGWHHLVLTAEPRGTRQDAVMYVDGQPVASGSVTRGASYSGWWRLGYGSLPTATGYPPSSNFVGSLDNVAGYGSRLTPARVSAHYAAR